MTVHKGGSAGVPDKIPPPVNNACLPDIYNKLDANAIEKTKVLNMQLSFRLERQEKVLSKYRNAAQQRYIREKDKLLMDLRNIGRRMPNFVDIPRLETKMKKLRKEKKAKTFAHHDCVFTTEPLDMKGISEKDEKPFCDRFSTHHLPTKSRFYQDILQSAEKGISMPDLRPRPGDRYRRLIPIISHHLSQDPLPPPTQDSLSSPTLDPRFPPTQDTLSSPTLDPRFPPTQDSLSSPTLDPRFPPSQDTLSSPTLDPLSSATPDPLSPTLDPLSSATPDPQSPTSDSLSPPTDDFLSSKLLPVIKSLDDNYMSSKSRFAEEDEDDDDIRTV